MISFRDIQAFHEECVEKIFFDLQRNCTPKELTVQANFLRRGGIELNPVRSNKKNFDADVLRDVRQWARGLVLESYSYRRGGREGWNDTMNVARYGFKEQAKVVQRDVVNIKKSILANK